MAASSKSQDGNPSKQTMRMTDIAAESSSDSDSWCGMPQHQTPHSQELAVIAPGTPEVSLKLGPGIHPDFPYGRSKVGKKIPAPIVGVGGRYGGLQSCKGWKKCRCGHCRNEHQREWPRDEWHWSITTADGREEMCIFSTWLRAMQRLKPKDDRGSRSQPPNRRKDGGPPPRRSQYARSQSPGPRARGRSPSRDDRRPSSGSRYYNYDTFQGWVSRLF